MVRSMSATMAVTWCSPRSRMRFSSATQGRLERRAAGEAQRVRAAGHGAGSGRGEAAGAQAAECAGAAGDVGAAVVVGVRAVQPEREVARAAHRPARSREREAERRAVALTEPCRDARLAVAERSPRECPG